MTEHWYDRSGKPAYETNGRPTTLRDARKLSLCPSVTTILSVVAKPALTNWLVNQGIMAALTGTRNNGETDAQYIARILADSKQQAIDAANEGTRIHDACERSFHGNYRTIENFVPTRDSGDRYMPHVFGMRKELLRIFPTVRDWVSEKSFAHPLGFGGKCDLHSPSTGIIVDFKTKDGDFSDGKKLAWDQHWQLAAYYVGLIYDDYTYRCEGDIYADRFKAPAAAIFISRTHPGAVASHVWSADEMAQGWRVFAAALRLHKLLRDYDGGW